MYNVYIIKNFFIFKIYIVFKKTLFNIYLGIHKLNNKEFSFHAYTLSNLIFCIEVMDCTFFI